MFEVQYQFSAGQIHMHETWMLNYPILYMPFIDGIHLWLLHSTASNINVYIEQETKLIDIPNCAKVQSLNKRQPASKEGLQKA